MSNISKTKVFLFDLDGTVYLGNKLIDGAKETLSYLRDKGIKICFLTNNSSKTDKEYLKKLKKLGIYSNGDFFYSSLRASAEYIKENYGDEKVYAVATKKAVRFLQSLGVNAVAEKDYLSADILLLTFDNSLTYSKIVKADALIKLSKVYIATHPDFVCPSEGFSIPDAGSFIELLKSSSNKTPDVIIGKPYPFMAEKIAKTFNVTKSQLTMVGDRLYTDMAFGEKAGINTVLVLTGETKLTDAKNSAVHVDEIIDGISSLKNFF